MNELFINAMGLIYGPRLKCLIVVHGDGECRKCLDCKLAHNNSSDRVRSTVVSMGHCSIGLDCWSYCYASLLFCHLLHVHFACWMLSFWQSCFWPQKLHLYGCCSLYSWYLLIFISQSHTHIFCFFSSLDHYIFIIFLIGCFSCVCINICCSFNIDGDYAISTINTFFW